MSNSSLSNHLSEFLEAMRLFLDEKVMSPEDKTLLEFFITFTETTTVECLRDISDYLNGKTKPGKHFPFIKSFKYEWDKRGA